MISLVTIAHGRRPQLQALLTATARMRPRPFELVLVDMGGGPLPAPPDGLPVAVVDMPVGSDEPLPLAAARNRGAAAARGTLLLFLDVDCLPGRDLAGEMRCALRRRDGLVMANVHDLPEGFVDDGEEVTRLTAGTPDPALAAVEANAVPPELFSATAFGVRRRVFHALGGFCEDYVGHGAEDTDLGMVAAAVGAPIVRWRSALAYHQWHPRSEPPVEHVQGIVHSARLFHERWGTWPMSDWLAQFAERGLVEWSPQAGELGLLREEVV